MSCYCTPSLLLPRYCCCNVQSCCRSAAARVCSISACLTITGLTCGSGAAAACVGYLVPPVATILAQDLLNEKQGVVTELVHAAAFNSRCGNWRGRQSAAMFSRPEILHPPLNVTIFISPWTGSYPDDQRTVRVAPIGIEPTSDGTETDQVGPWCCKVSLWRGSPTVAGVGAWENGDTWVHGLVGHSPQ